MARREEREAERERTIMQLKRELSSNKKELNAYRLKDTRSALEKAVSGARCMERRGEGATVVGRENDNPWNPQTRGTPSNCIPNGARTLKLKAFSAWCTISSFSLQRLRRPLRLKRQALWGKCTRCRKRSRN
jgi:hypothetical protein